MAKDKSANIRANESVSKFKLLSAYGGPGSIVHTSYGSIIISCIEEWGFISRIIEIRKQALEIREDENIYVPKHAMLEDLYISNDERLLLELQKSKMIPNLKYLALVPSIEVNDFYNTINQGKSYLAINSEFMPKGFYDRNGGYKLYSDWYKAWPNGEESFFPPKYLLKGESKTDAVSYEIPVLLKQDNLVLICSNGHLSDFPWSRFLRWRTESPHDLSQAVELFSIQKCCKKPNIQIKETSANASGFDGKWLKCNNTGCESSRGVSLKGIMSLKVICPGHKPWESETGSMKSYFGKNDVRNSFPPTEPCGSREIKVALTTGNNLYFSRSISSIFMPGELFLSEVMLKKRALEVELEVAKDKNDFERCIAINSEIKNLEMEIDGTFNVDDISDEDREVIFRHQEFRALSEKNEEDINITRSDLLVKDVSGNLDNDLSKYFKRILRVDILKVTSAQLDFSRVEPLESGSTVVQSKNIFRSRPEDVLVYPVVENYGEGIFFSFDQSQIEDFMLDDTMRYVNLFSRPRTDFAKGAVNAAQNGNWQLYLVHSFCHLLMRELEFRCGYPTASLSERLYVSNEENSKMYGCLIYTAEGAEGSMGGLIAQTRKSNLNGLIKSALLRATICNSDPLCWQSDGQGLFELNLASCFSCGLVSETSCEHRNIYLDRRILIDEDFGYFKDVIKSLV